MTGVQTCALPIYYPEAFALPAGHGDGVSLADAAKKESEEEVGALILENKLVWSGKIDNPCKREGGDHHFWEVYQAISWSGELKAGSDAKEFFWCSPKLLRQLAKRTEYFMTKYTIPHYHVGELTKAIFGDPVTKNTDPEWKAEMGLEPVWYFILKQLRII